MMTNRSKTDLVWSKGEADERGDYDEVWPTTCDEIRYADYGKETPNKEIDHIWPKFSGGSEYPKYINMSKYADKAICISAWEYR